MLSILFLEMKSMEHDSDQLNELQKQKSELIEELFMLQRKLKGIIFMNQFNNLGIKLYTHDSIIFFQNILAQWNLVQLLLLHRSRKSTQLSVRAEIYLRAGIF